ncbi:hypothetical protein FAI41_05690 [Acetobacteraceae bacterium]|nr:hypothetical protein FAI41_05690 [Acetobacteraceae bacterium]
MHISPKVGTITHYTVADIGVPVSDEAGSADGGSQKNTHPFEPMKTGLPTDILIDPATFYPKPGEPLSPPVSLEKPDPAPQPAPAHHKRHHHHHHRHHKH